MLDPATGARSWECDVREVWLANAPVPAIWDTPDAGFGDARCGAPVASFCAAQADGVTRPERAIGARSTIASAPSSTAATSCPDPAV